MQTCSFASSNAVWLGCNCWELQGQGSWTSCAILNLLRPMMIDIRRQRWHPGHEEERMRIPLLLLPPCWRCWIASLWRTCAASAPPWAGAATLPAPKIWWKIGGKQKDGGSDSDDPDDRQATKLAHRAAAAGNLDGHGSDTDDNHDDDDGDAASGEEDTEGENAASPLITPHEALPATTIRRSSRPS
jgi:hypothetical protein